LGSSPIHSSLNGIPKPAAIYLAASSRSPASISFVIESSAFISDYKFSHVSFPLSYNAFASITGVALAKILADAAGTPVTAPVTAPTASATFDSDSLHFYALAKILAYSALTPVTAPVTAPTASATFDSDFLHFYAASYHPFIFAIESL